MLSELILSCPTFLSWSSPILIILSASSLGVAWTKLLVVCS